MAARRRCRRDGLQRPWQAIAVTPSRDGTGEEVTNVSDRGEWYEHLQQRFAAPAARGIEAVYQLRFDDAPPYQLQVSDNAMTVTEGEATAPTVTVFFDSFANHAAIIEGRLDPMQAFLAGQFRADGHIVLVMRMLQLFVPQYAMTRPEQLH